jgi:uncharacterized DUF497 family protein
MRFLYVIWDDENEPDSNIQHVAQHGLTTEDIEFVLENPQREETSRSTGRPCCFGHTPAGDFIIVVYEEIDKDTVYPITAYEVSE